MRVRHKTERREVEYRVIDEGASYWIGHGVDRLMAEACEAVALPKADYEPVPETRWEGITAQCEVTRDGAIHHRDERHVPGEIPGVLKFVGWVQAPYRLRLVNHVLIVNGALIVERETC